MADQEAQVEIPEAWVGGFVSAVEAQRTATAPGAWDEIEQAGLEAGALLLLYGYAGGADRDIGRMQRRTKDASSRMRAAIREEEVAQTASPKRAHNSGLFRERAFRRLQNAFKADWPMPTASVRTVGDELGLASQLKGREIPLDAARKAMVKAAGERSPVNEMYFLMLLQDYAARHGVTLGVNRLVALANCARPRQKLDASTLARYLRSVPQPVRDGIRRDVLPNLPPPMK